MATTPPERCFQVFRQTTGAMYAGMAPIESAKAVKGTLPAVLMILMLQRGMSNFESISHLARQGKLNEAMMLGRPLFEESVLLQHAARRSSEKRNARIVWHQHAAWSEWIDTLQRFTPDELGGRNPVELIDDARREIAVLEAYIAEHGASKKPAELTYRARALELGRARECLAYDISGQLMHTRGVTVAGRSKRGGDGKVVLNLRDERSDGLLPLLTYWSATSIIHAFVAVATVMSWQVPEQIDGIVKYLQRMKVFD